MKLPAHPRRWTIATLGAAAGLAAGVTLGGLGIANAASSSSSSTTPSVTAPAGTAPAGTAPAGAAPGGTAPPGAPGGGYHGLPLSGTVTAVGTDSVTIKTGTATTTYAVTSSSDIDKNGEATLSDLVAGDAVTFNTTTTGSTVSIDKLHAGSEALDRPTGPPGGAPGSMPASGTTAA